MTRIFGLSKGALTFAVAHPIYGRFDSWSLEGALGGAIAEGVRIRGAARIEKADGYIKSSDTDVLGNGAVILPGSGQALGGRDGWAGRVNLQVDLSPDATLSLWYKHSEDNNVPTGGYVFENCDFEPNGYCHTDDAGLSDGTGGVINGITGNPASPWEHFGERRGSLDRNTNSYQGELNWEFANDIKLTSITNYLELKKRYAEDGDALPVLVINLGTDVDFDQFSQEFRLSGESDMLKWQVGAYYLDMNYNGVTKAQGAPAIRAAVNNNGDYDSPQVSQFYKIDSKNWSVFAQGDINITDQLSATLGARYSSDKKSIDYLGVLSDPVINPNDIVLFNNQSVTAVAPGADKIDYDDWAARISLNYEASDDVLLFISWNRGIKGGNWSLAANIQPASFQHKPEKLNSFEAGFKSSLMGRQLRLNGTLFHYKYDDYQAFSLTGAVPQVSNSDAHSTGAELEAFWSPSPRFDAILGATWQTSSVDSTPGPGEQTGPEFFPGAPNSQSCVNQGGFFFCDYPQDNITDAEFPNAPRFSLNYLLRYNFGVPSGNVTAQIDGVWYDDQFMEVTNGLSSLQKAYNVTNASLSYTEDKTGISITAWTKNVFNKA